MMKTPIMDQCITVGWDITEDFSGGMVMVTGIWTTSFVPQVALKEIVPCVVVMVRRTRICVP